MNCKVENTTVSAYMDGQLTADEAADFKLHMQACRTCQMALQAQEKVKTFLGATYTAEKAPVALRANIRRALAREDKAPSLLSMLLRQPKAVVALAMSAVIVCILSIQGYRALQPPEMTPIAQVKDLHAHIECIGCHYAALSLASQKYCEQLGHEPAIMSAAGEIFSFLPNAKSQEISSHELHSEVIISGWVFYQANFIEVEDYQIVEPTVAFADDLSDSRHP